MSSKYNVWTFNYEFLGLDSGDEKNNEVYYEIDLDEILNENYIDEDSGLDSDGNSILGELISEMDIDEDVSVDMTYQELEVDLEDLDSYLDEDIDSDIKGILDEI